MSKTTDNFYKTTAWYNLAKAIKKERGGICELCIQQGIVTAGEIVHHKVPVTPENMYDASVTLDPNNLMLLCRPCHGKIHSKKRYSVDANGRIL